MHYLCINIYHSCFMYLNISVHYISLFHFVHVLRTCLSFLACFLKVGTFKVGGMLRPKGRFFWPSPLSLTGKWRDVLKQPLWVSRISRAAYNTRVFVHTAHARYIHKSTHFISVPYVFVHFILHSLIILQFTINNHHDYSSVFHSFIQSTYIDNFEFA